MIHSCIKVIPFIEVVQCIYSLFSSSTKRWKILLDNVPILIVKSLSNTHWKSRIKSVKAIRFQGPQIRLALLELQKSCDDAKSMCIGTTIKQLKMYCCILKSIEMKASHLV